MRVGRLCKNDLAQALREYALLLAMSGRTRAAQRHFDRSLTVAERLMNASGPQYIELRIGNEPAGRVDFQSRGFLKPKAVFTVVIPKEAAVDGRLTLVAEQHCNLHGLWESSADITVL